MMMMVMMMMVMMNNDSNSNSNSNNNNNNSEKMFPTFPGGSQVPASSSKRVVKVWLEIEELAHLLDRTGRKDK